MSYNAEQDLKYIDSNLTFLMYVVGLDGDDLGTVTIDAFIGAVRDMIKVPTLGDSDAIGATSVDPALSCLKSQKHSLMSNIRRFWYLRTLAIGAINRG
jgi:hypothetical protein